ncbi:MAG: S41 family peptidase [Clostridiales bacterium]|nr:S41 family peptidase [Clostridiales bacterium]
MKRNYVAVVLAGLLMLVLTAQAGAASMLPMFKNQESDTVTISREEYDRLLQYSKLDTLMQLVEAYYYEDADTDAMLEGAALGLMQGIGDVYSTYYTKEEMDKFNEETEGEYAGIGCQLLADPEDTTITVTRVFKNSPADEAGIRSGDKIVYVNDVYYSAYEMDEAVSVMRGTPGEKVKVTVLRGLETIDFDITRKIVNINYVEYEILEGNIGYVMVFDFLGDAYEGFAQAIAAFEEAGVSGMIIDLRNNGGGLVDACVQMADLILPEGVVVSMRDKAGQTTEYTIDGEYYDVPMVVLVNGYSASASEILAGAIRDTGAGTLVGEKTFGKGVVQSVINFPDGSGMKVTTARYYTPSGECIHEIGIEPDVEVSLDEDAVTRYGINNLPHDKDAQLQKAIELLSPQTEEAQVEDAA